MVTHVPHLDIDETSYPGIIVFTVNRRRYIDAQDIDEFGRELLALVEGRNQPRFVFVWSTVDFLSSVALNKLMLFHRACRIAEGRYVFCGMNAEIYEVLAITRLNLVFPIEGSLPAAIDRLRKRPNYPYSLRGVFYVWVVLPASRRVFATLQDSWA